MKIDTRSDRGVVLTGLLVTLLTVVLGVGAAVGLSMGLVATGSDGSQVTKPLVTYNAP